MKRSITALTLVSLLAISFTAFAAGTYGLGAGQFGNPGINTCLTITPGLSQFSTSFIASWRQDIPHMPLVAWPH